VPDPVPIHPAVTPGVAADDEVARLRRRLAREHRTRLESEDIAERAITRLYAADKLKNSFLATISHELRTPLTSIAGFTALLLQSSADLDGDQQRDMLERIDRNARVLLGLIEDILDFSTLEEQQPSLALDEVALRPLTLSAMTQLGAVLDHHALDVAVPSHVRAMVDERSFVRMLRNILTNAVRYAPPGTTVRVDATTDGGRCHLVIDDEGPGVPPDEQPFVFERFFRGRGEWVTRTRGSGIGLSVVRHLVESMGGTVAVGEAPGGGARFTVTLGSPPG
jgi:signal transduction histidine kinase